jgi:hypothetical protein
MVYGQEKLIPDEYLEDFLNCLGYGWDCGWSAQKIAKEMGFGEPDGIFYEKLKPYHVYYFVQRYGKEWGMEPRRKVKKKEEEKQTEVQYSVPYTNDMPFIVANWLRGKGWLLE